MTNERRERAETEPDVPDANEVSQDTADSARRENPGPYPSAADVTPVVGEDGEAHRLVKPVEPGPDSSAPDRDRTDIYDPGERPKELRP